MIYFIVLFLLYILSEKMINIKTDDSDITKKIKNCIKIFFILACMLNLYGYCLSNIIYSCVMIYIISFIKNDDIKTFIDSLNINKEHFNPNFYNNENIFSRTPAEFRQGNKNVLKYNINEDSYNNIKNLDVKNAYNKDDLKKIKTILERKFWMLGKNDTYDMYEKNMLEEEEEIVKTVNEFYKLLCRVAATMLSFIGL